VAEYKQIIIGQGTSAYTYLHYAYIGGKTRRGKRFDPRRGKILIIGKSDLWKQFDAEHRIGQPPHLLRLPGQPLPALSDDFTPTEDYQKKQKDLQNRANIDVSATTLYDHVSKVTWGGQDYTVTTVETQKTYTADMVIIAGTGRQMKPNMTGFKGLELDSDDKPYKRVLDAVTYTTTEQPNVPIVCVHGSSATSSWAISRAIKSKVGGVIWLSRSGFGEANPAGRNNDVITAALENGWMVIGDIGEIAYCGFHPGGVKGGDFQTHQKTVRLHFKTLDEPARRNEVERKLKDRLSGPTIYAVYKKAEQQLMDSIKTQGNIEWQAFLKVKDKNGDLQAVKGVDELPYVEGRTGEKPYIDVNQYVYAIGAEGLANPTINGGILDPSVGTLQPVFDEDGRFGDKAEDTVIAFRDERARLYVVGAAVFRTGPPDVRAKYANVTQMLSRGGQPPEGIAGIVASIRALTGVHETLDITNSFATADFKQLERWAENLYWKMKRDRETTLPWTSLPPEVQRFVADQIVALRKHTDFATAHLKKEGGENALVATVKFLLSNKANFESFAPPELLKKWEPAAK
jgi:hypothetical protein